LRRLCGSAFRSQTDHRLRRDKLMSAEARVDGSIEVENVSWANVVDLKVGIFRLFFSSFFKA